MAAKPVVNGFDKQLAGRVRIVRVDINSPNGKKIAFVRRYRSRAAQALCTMAADGSHFRTITSPFYAIGFPSWQPLR